jgi:hypothetical protein
VLSHNSSNQREQGQPAAVAGPWMTGLCGTQLTAAAWLRQQELL